MHLLFGTVIIQHGRDCVPGHPFVQYFCTERHLRAEVDVCVFKNDYLLAGPRVCCVDLRASGATSLHKPLSDKSRSLDHRSSELNVPPKQS